MNKIILSALSHTWLIDLDGTVVVHNSHLTGSDQLLPGIQEFWKNIPDNDRIIILTSRSSSFSKTTISFLRAYSLRFDHIIFDLPHGERILINDTKPSGLQTAYALNLKRDSGMSNFTLMTNEDL